MPAGPSPRPGRAGRALRARASRNVRAGRRPRPSGHVLAGPGPRRRRAQGPRRRRRRGADPDVRGRLRRRPDDRDALAVGAHGGDGDAGLLEPLRRRRGGGPGGSSTRASRPAAVDAGDEGAVGQFSHGRLPEHPVRPVELGLEVGSACGRGRRRPARPARPDGRRAATTRRGPRRSATCRRPPTAAAPPTRPARPRPATARPPLRARAHRAGPLRQPGHQDDRCVPGHVGVVPRDHRQAGARRVDPGLPVEVVSFDERARAGLRTAGRECDDAAHRPRHAVPVHLAHGQDPVPVGRRAQPAVIVDLTLGRCRGQRARRG